MSTASTPRASDLAAQQVEQIVSAAQAAADEIRNEARREQQDIRRAAQRDEEETSEKARQDADGLLASARKEAILLEQDARRDAEAMLEDARVESAQLRQKTQRAVDGRVAAAERSAAEVLEEARALSGGLHQLGKSLEEHAGRILRDVQAAHKRMQADLRVGAGPPGRGDLDGDGEDFSPRTSSPRSDPARRAAETARGDGKERASGGAAPGSKRRNPIEDLEVPPWVVREN